ncbi:cysteine desulfurase [Patescibacteria group bacterium]|nr:cysteine desulfurase [Patescibacteria group bacterium]
MIYLDYNATTPVDKRVVDAMIPFFGINFANSASDHSMGVEAKNAVDKSRLDIANLIHAKSNEIVFTSGATESNNLALLGFASKNKGDKNHIITSRIEHPSVLNPCKHLESLGFQVTYLPVDKYGLVDPDVFEDSVTKDTFLISIMFANNEVGTIQSIYEIGRIARRHNILFHTDAAQAVGYVPIDVDKMNIDLMSMSAHKFYGPKGVGALFVRSRIPRVSLLPIVFGGGQERGMRSGTLNVPLIVGMGVACKLVHKNMPEEHKRFKVLVQKIYEEIKQNNLEVKINGHDIQRLPHNLNIEIPGVDNKWLLLKMKDFCFSTGSACSVLHDEPSYVLSAMGLDRKRINNCIRISIGRDTTDEEVNSFVDDINKYTKESVSVN